MAHTRFNDLRSPEQSCQEAATQVAQQAAHNEVAPDSAVDLEKAAAKGTAGPEDTQSETVRAGQAESLPRVLGYDILKEIGRGSMGVVYKARQKDLDRLVALKMILAGHHRNQETAQRFIAEARVVSSLQHPNIVQLYEIRLHQDRPFFSMELVEGGTLADRLKGCPQPFRPAAQLILTLARAIQVAHANGIVHRDLKPANILMASTTIHNSHVHRMALEMGLHPPDLFLGMPKITDFGLAKQLHTDKGATESGMILGTPSYMAPEQAEGKSSTVGPAADIYALGAILYEMLTGRPPFTAESPLETVMLLFQTEPIPPSRLQPKIPRSLETICLKCLQKEPHRRYVSAEALADDLQRFLTGEPVLARPASLHEKVWKWMRRRPVPATLAACSALAAVTLLGLGLWHQVDLRTRLGQALEDERAARAAQEDASAREHVGQVRGKVMELLSAGESAIATQDWRKAQLQLTRARDHVANQPELAMLRARVERLLQQTNQQQLDHERLQRFLRCRGEALFHATLFTGTDLESTLKETRSAALEALALFGATPETMAAPAIDSPYFDERKKAEILADCYELLLVLAEAVARPVPGRQASDQRGREEEAIQILDRAARLGITTHAYYRRRARHLAQAGQDEDAQRERLRAEALNPSTALDHFLLGEDQYHQGDYRQASHAFESVLQLQSNHFWASYYLALCELKTQRPDRAVARLTACLGWRPDFPWLYLLRASAWGELGQFAHAEADFLLALRTPLSDAARYGLLINRGVLRIRQGQLDSAIADLQQAIALRPEQYQAYVNLAQAHVKGQRLDDAIEQLDQAIRREPELASLYRTRARVHLMRQDQDAAQADLDRAIQMEVGASAALLARYPENGPEAPDPQRAKAEHANPALAEDHLERGRLLHRQKEYERAVEAYDATLELRPRDARACRLRAEALLELSRWPEALQSLDDCLKYGPPDAGVFRARAALRTRLGQYAGAQTDFTRALEIEPDAAIYAARGWCYLVANAPRLALADFEESIRLAPQQSDAYAGRGFGRVLLGKYRSAIADAEEALRRGPQSPRLYFNVARIYAQAVARLESDPLRSRRTIDAWQERAVHMLAKALDTQPAADAARFWQDVIYTDKALDPIRRGAGFRQLAARYPLSDKSVRPRDFREPDSSFESASQSALHPEP